MTGGSGSGSEQGPRAATTRHKLERLKATVMIEDLLDGTDVNG
jgi:hypothetical protein